MNSAWRIAWLFCAFLAWDNVSRAEGLPDITQLDPPGPGEFIVDRANLLSSADKDKIKQICDKLLTDKATTIFVVTIDSMTEHGSSRMFLGMFARRLLNQWHDHSQIDDNTWNKGILLVVSKNDTKFPDIVLGEYWQQDFKLANQIVNEQMMPRIKSGDHAAGIVAGVESLDKLARGLQITKPPPLLTTKQYFFIALVVGLAILMIASLIRRGASGVAWLFWGLVFAAVGALCFIRQPPTSAAVAAVDGSRAVHSAAAQ